ncbi:hypothetical protein BRX36_02535 [Sphingomonas sp. S-NIH.Pt1_0416]|nr:hypothetical protein BRX36_02535 [Sphingomonas sp. S-NIH.Pt1_0416]
MNMIKRTHEQQAANLITATGHLLTGSPRRQAELDDNLAIIVGPPIHPLNLLNWTSWVRSSRRNIVHMSFREDWAGVPNVALVFVDDDDCAVVAEHCWLWLPQSGGRCWLIPDGEGWGAYRLDADLKLRHHPRAQVRGEKARQDGYRRAYRRFADILEEQSASGFELPLPEQLRTAA